MQLRHSKEKSSSRFQTRWYRITASIIAVIWLSLVAMPSADAQSGLRRLFSTPALRAELDRRRLRELQPGVELVAPIVIEPFTEVLETGDAPAPDTIYAIGGSMRRSDGSYTIWINDVATNSSDLPANMELVQPFDQGQIQIRNPETGASFLVKPGQVLNLTQGELIESYEYRSRIAAAARMRAAASAASAAANSVSGSGSATTDAVVPAADVDANPLIIPGAAELLEEAQRVRAIPQ